MSASRFARWMTVSLAAVCFGMAADSARAAVVINVQTFGPDVVATATGSLNLTGLTQGGTGSAANFGIQGVNSFISIGNLIPNTEYPYFTGFTGPKDFTASAIWSIPNTNTGDFIGLINGTNSRRLSLPFGYTSGAPLAATMTFNNKTLADMGLDMALVEGSFVYSWSGDSLTVNFSNVPEPGSLGVLAVGCVGLIRRRRR